MDLWWTFVLVAVATHVKAYGTSCDEGFVLSDLTTSGIIRSYNFPFHYQNNLHCVYRIYISTDTGHDAAEREICFRFRRFSLGTSRDHVTFYQNDLPFVYQNEGNLTNAGGNVPYDIENVWREDFCWRTAQGILKLTFDSDGDITDTGFYADFWMKNTELHRTKNIRNDGFNQSQKAPCFGSDQWTCFNRECIQATARCDQNNSCGDWSDEMYYHAGCTQGQGRPSMQACDFSTSWCRFIGIFQPGWYVESSSSDPERGPATDHTTATDQGNFVHTVFKHNYKVADSVGLVDDTTILSPGVDYCLSFWYHMKGPRLGRLLVHLDDQNRRPLWSRTSNYQDRWLHAQIHIGGLEENSEVYFEGLRSHDTNSSIALDDISLSQDEPFCKTEDISCNFEYGFCGWENILFIKNTGRFPPLGPDHDPISEHGGEYYAAYKGLTSLYPTALTSPMWGGYTSSTGQYIACLQLFLYIADTGETSSFVITTRGVDGNETTHKALGPSENQWAHLKEQDQPGKNRSFKSASRYLQNPDAWKQGTWKEHSVEVFHNTPFQIKIETSVPNYPYDRTVHFAIDEIVVSPGGCSLVALQSCPLEEFLCHSGHGCVEKEDLCDGERDCADGSDEDPPACCFKADCEPGQYCCHNGMCTWDANVCDGINNCGDWSDEDICSETCDPRMFACEDGSRCIHTQYICDGDEDCEDGSDERKCFGYLPPAAITGIVITIVVIALAIIARCVFCKKSGDRCPPRPCCGERSEQGSDTDTVADVSDLYQQPPDYQECVNNPLYQTPEHGENKRQSHDVNGDTPPSYDRIEKGDFETITVPEESALKRLRRAIMNKSQEALDTTNPSDDSLSTVAVTASMDVYAEINEHEFHSELNAMGPECSGAGQTSHGPESVTIQNEESGGFIGNPSRRTRERGSTTIDGLPTLPNEMRQGGRDKHPNQTADVHRNNSELSTSSLPRYSQITHPPAYDNLSFCDSDEEDLYNRNKSDRIAYAKSHSQHAQSYQKSETGRRRGVHGQKPKPSSKLPNRDDHIHNRSHYRNKNSDSSPYQPSTPVHRTESERTTNQIISDVTIRRQWVSEMGLYPLDEDQTQVPELDPRDQHASRYMRSKSCADLVMSSGYSRSNQDQRQYTNDASNLNYGQRGNANKTKELYKTQNLARSMPCLAQNCDERSMYHNNVEGPEAGSSEDFSGIYPKPHRPYSLSAQNHSAVARNEPYIFNLRKSKSQLTIRQCSESSV